MEYQYYDRSYRIRYNKISMTMDRAAVTGALVGTAFAKYKGFSMLGGGAVGLGLGTFSGLVYQVVKNKQN